MAAGSIIIDLLMKTGSFETDTKRAEASLKRMTKTAKDSSKGIRDSFAGNLLADFVGGITRDLARLPSAIINSVDKLNDVKDATGASIENLSALEDVGARTGTSFDTITGALVKFNQGLKDADPDNPVALALKRIGLNAEELRKMDPAQALLVVSKALQGYAADGDRARLVQDLFGKSTRDTAAFLKDLAEKGKLVATVTTEQAQEAEDFNKELFAMQKNVSDLSRGFMMDLVTSINAAAKAMREGGLIEGIRALFGGTEKYKADKEFAQLTDDLLRAQENLAKVKDLHEKPWVLGTGKSVAFWEGEVARLDAATKTLLAARNAPMSFDALRAGEKNVAPLLPSVGSAPVKGPKGPDPDADFKSYLSNLEKQIQATRELTVSEKLLDDIRRKSLTVSPAQQKQLEALAAQIDAEKSAMDVAQERQKQRNTDYDAAVAATRELEAADRAWLHSLTDDTPTKNMEKLVASLERLDRALEEGFDPQVIQEARNALQGLTAENTKFVDDFTLGLSEAQQSLIDLGTIGTGALRDMIVGGKDFGDVLKDVGLQIADLLFQLLVVKPIMDSITSAVSGGGVPANPYYSAFGSILGGLFGGAKAGGGYVQKGRSYDVGEFGPERFTPTTAGVITPTGGGGLGGGRFVFEQNGWVFGDVASMGKVRQEIANANRQLIAGVKRQDKYGRGT